mmetsp:Transcript_11118/g.36585  ORF Transcript_11118/g.36585 Transcript_11118/m.36585 type:complete len:351 (-) Transcript_11118:468-1520(-)
MDWLMSLTYSLICSSVWPFSSSTAVLACVTSSSVFCVSLNPETPRAFSVSVSLLVTVASCCRRSASVRSSTLFSACTTSSSFFIFLYLASLPLTASYLCLNSSPLSTFDPAPSTSPTFSSYSSMMACLRCWSRSSLAITSSFLRATDLATCACCRSWRSPCWFFCEALRERSSFTSASTRSFCAYMPWRSPSEFTGAASTIWIACTRFCTRSISRGIFSFTLKRFDETSSASCETSAPAEPSASDDRISRSRTAAFWYRASATSIRSRSLCIDVCSCTSSSCFLRSLVHTSAISATSSGLPLRCTFCFVCSIFTCSCSRSASIESIFSFIFTGSLFDARFCSSDLCTSTN